MADKQSITLALITLDHRKKFQNSMKSTKPLGHRRGIAFDGTIFGDLPMWFKITFGDFFHVIYQSFY